MDNFKRIIESTHTNNDEIKRAKIEFSINFKGTDNELENLKSIIDHHLEYFINFDEFPEIISYYDADMEVKSDSDVEYRRQKAISDVNYFVKHYMNSLELNCWDKKSPGDKFTVRDVFDDQFDSLETYSTSFDIDIQPDETGKNIKIFAKEFPEDYVTIPMKKFGLYDKDVEGHYRIFNTYQEAEDYINSIQ